MNFDFNITGIHRVIMVGREEYPEQITEFNPKSLRHNELIYNLSGHSKVFFNGKELLNAEKNIRFLPKGECFEYRVERMERGECIDVCFDTDVPISDEAFMIDTSKQESLEPLFKKLFCSFVAKDEGYRFECMSLLYKIFSELQKSSYIPESKFRLIKPAIEIIRSDFLSREIHTGELARVSGVSETYIKRLFCERFGMPPKRYIIQMKINHAAELLRFGEYKISDVALMSGYSDVYFFSRQFKKYMGISPSDFVKKYKSSK
jgi:AraC-like DNA-binding protein